MKFTNDTTGVSRNMQPRPALARNAILSGVLCTAIIPTAAWAEDRGSDQIVVTGDRMGDANPHADPDAPYKVDRSSDTRFTEPVRDTPKSVTIIPKEVIEDVGATTFRELARTTPGVTLGTGEGGNAFGDRIFIRGFEARNDIYIDGQRDPGVSSREIFAIEQVEIVKGPSSAYMGRGTTGGSVGLQSKKPSLGNDFAIAEVTAGTDNLWRGTLDANYELAPGLALRTNGFYHTADIPGRDYVDTQRYGGALALLWQAAPDLSFNLDYYHFRSDGLSDYGHPFDPETQEPYAVDPDNFYGAVGRDFLENDADIATFAAQWQPVTGLTLRSQTRYGEVDNRYVVSVPRAPDTSAADPADWTVSTGSPQRNATTQYIGNITSATAEMATGAVEHTLVLGGEYSHEKITNRRYTFPAFVETDDGTQLAVSGGFTLNLFDPDPVLGYTIPALLDTATAPSVTNVESFSIFLLDTIKLSQQFQLLLGGRYDTFEITSTGTSRGTPFALSADYGFLNTQASLLYKPVEAISLYASFATSSNPSGEQLDSSSATYGGLSGVDDLRPERNKAYEIGAKWEAGGDLLLTAAAFRIDKSNARENAGGGVWVNVGDQRSEGIELGANGQLTSRLAVFGGYTYLDARIRNSIDPAAEGAQFANVPKHSASLLTTYALTDRLTMGAQAFYRSRIYGGTSAAGTASVPGYWKFDMVGRYRVSDAVELRANVLNIFDKRYYDAIYRSGSPFSYVAPGRSATISASVQF